MFNETQCILSLTTDFFKLQFQWCPKCKRYEISHFPSFLIFPAIVFFKAAFFNYN